MRGLARHLGTGSVEVVSQHGLVVGMCAVLDDGFCSFLRAESSEICITLLCNDYHDLMLRVVHVGAHGNDGGNGSVLGDG